LISEVSQIWRTNTYGSTHLSYLGQAHRDSRVEGLEERNESDLMEIVSAGDAEQAVKDGADG
jgi:hypothetical protein